MITIRFISAEVPNKNLQQKLVNFWKVFCKVTHQKKGVNAWWKIPEKCSKICPGHWPGNSLGNKWYRTINFITHLEFLKSVQFHPQFLLIFISWSTFLKTLVHDIFLYSFFNSKLLMTSLLWFKKSLKYVKSFIPAHINS